MQIVKADAEDKERWFTDSLWQLLQNQGKNRRGRRRRRRQIKLCSLKYLIQISKNYAIMQCVPNLTYDGKDIISIKHRENIYLEEHFPSIRGVTLRILWKVNVGCVDFTVE